MRLVVAADGRRPPAAAAALAGLDSTVARLAGAYRVALPRLFAAYHRHRLQADPTSDGSAIRTLDLLVPDVVGRLARGRGPFTAAARQRGGRRRVGSRGGAPGRDHRHPPGVD